MIETLVGCCCIVPSVILLGFVFILYYSRDFMMGVEDAYKESQDEQS